MSSKLFILIIYKSMSSEKSYFAYIKSTKLGDITFSCVTKNRKFFIPHVYIVYHEIAVAWKISISLNNEISDVCAIR